MSLSVDCRHVSPVGDKLLVNAVVQEGMLVGLCSAAQVSKRLAAVVPQVPLTSNEHFQPQCEPLEGQFLAASAAAMSLLNAKPFDTPAACEKVGAPNCILCARGLVDS